MKVYIVIELTQGAPKIIGVYRTKKDAEKTAYKDANAWRNIIERIVE